MMCVVEMASCGKVSVTSFMKIGSGVQAILRLCLRNLRGRTVGNTDGRDF
jgi:hypothetical protein